MSRAFTGRKKVKVTIEGVTLTCTFFKKGLGGKPSATCSAFDGSGGGKKASKAAKTKKKSKNSKRRGR